MKKSCLLVAGLFIGFACSSSPDRTGGKGGAGGEDEGTGGATATGGKQATGGSPGTGGAPATGGASGNTGGSGGSSTGGAAGSTGGAGGAATGGAGGATGGAPGGTGGAPGGSPAAALDQFTLLAPCPGMPSGAGNCQIPNAADRKQMKMVTFGGNPATTYKVKLHLCGGVEGRNYTGCKPNADGNPSFICLDGMPGTNNTTYPAYSMTVGDPMHVYYLNQGYKADDLIKIDYSATFEIKGGTTITFASDGGSNADVYSTRWKGHNFMCDGVPMITQPYWGQFIYVKVESVDPAQ